MKKLLRGMLLLAAVGCFSVSCFAWDDELAGTTEITGYYQQYRNFSFDTGNSLLDFSPTALAGGGFSIARNFAEWFAIWMQLSVGGTTTQDQVPLGLNITRKKNVRIINELQGIRYQTKQYGPFRLFGKVGAGFTNYSLYEGLISATKFSAGWGGGVNVWMSNNIGITLDVSHILMGLPNLELEPESGRQKQEKFDSGMNYTTGITFRF